MLVLRYPVAVYGLLAFGLWVALSVAAYAIVLPSYLRIEQQQMQETLTRIQNTLDQNIGRLEAAASDYAHWDDTYRFVQNRNQEFIDNNIAADTLSNLNLDTLALVTTSGQTVLAVRYNAATDSLVSVPSHMQAWLGQAQQDFPSRTLGGLWLVGGQIQLLALRPVLRSNLSGPPQGALIMTQILNIAALERQLAVRLQLGASNLETTERFTSSTYTKALLLRDIYNQPLATLWVSLPRVVFAQGWRALGLLMGAVTLMLGLTVWGLHSFNVRLSRLHREQLASEQRYRALVEQAADGVALIEPQNQTIAEANPQLAQLLNYPLPDLLHRQLNHIMPWPEIPTNNWSGFSTEGVLLKQGGESLQAEISLSPVEYAGQLYWLLIAHDITERKRLREENYRLFMQNFQGVAYRVALHSGRIQMLEGQVENLTGFPASVFLLGQRHWRRMVYPPDWPLVKRALSKLLRPSGTLDLTLRIRNRQRELRWVNVLARQVPDPTGAEPLVQGVITDVTERHLADEKLRQQEQQLRLITNAMSDVVMFADAAGRIQFVTPSIAQVLGYTPNEMLGRNALEFIEPQDWPKVQQEAQSAFAERRSYKNESRFLHKDGHWVWMESAGNFIFDAQGQLAGSVWGNRDVTERKEYEAQIEYLAYYDTLTRLPNRRLLQSHIEALLQQPAEVVLVYIDLDRFKTVNDSMGHDAGDELLVQVAERLQTVWPSAFLARLGGDEFACVWSQETSDPVASTAQATAALQAPLYLRGQRIDLAVSAGVALYPQHGRSFIELLKAADMAMYQAKRQGGGVALYQPSHVNYSRERLQFEAELREAIENQSLSLAYQPILDLRTGIIEGYEGLMRWNKNQEVLVASQFIPLAEESGLIEAIDRVALREGLRQLAHWIQDQQPWNLSLNLSAKTLQRPEIVEQLALWLKEWNVPAERLTLEITESALLLNFESALKVMGGLHRLGVRLAVDDFGSGYASLAYLRHIPAHCLKIDRSLVRGIGHSAKEERLLEAVIALGHGLYREVLAEGVETLQQLEWLKAKQCGLVQGYLVGKPHAWGLLETAQPN